MGKNVYVHRNCSWDQKEGNEKKIKGRKGEKNKRKKGEKIRGEKVSK